MKRGTKRPVKEGREGEVAIFQTEAPVGRPVGDKRKLKRELVTSDILVGQEVDGRCPRDGGLVAWVAGDLTDGVCLNCGWQRYTIKGVEVAYRSLGRVQAEEVSTSKRAELCRTRYQEQRGRQDDTEEGEV